MYLSIEDEKFIETYHEIWENVSNKIRKEFDSEPLLNKNFLKLKKKINTKEGFKCIYIPVILIDSVYRKEKNYCF